MSWNRSTTLHFLESLLKARRNHHLLLSAKKTAFRELCKSLVKDMEAKFPDENWTVKKLENKHNYLRCFWKAFREAAERPNTTYNTETKTLRMSSHDFYMFRSKYPKYGKAITSQPLLTNHTIDYNEWLEIFSQEAPACEDMTKSNILRYDDANLVGASRRSCIADWLERCADSMDNTSSLSSVEDVDNSGGIVVQQPRKRRRTLRATSQSSTPSPALPAMLLGGLNHNIIIQPSGAEDLEKACKDAQRLREEHGVATVIRVLSWLAKDPRNAIIWNALVSNELKIAWIASDFGQNA